MRAVAAGLNGTGFEEAIFLERVLGIIASHDPKVPLYIYYPMHLVHSPLCVPEGYLERFDFIRHRDPHIMPRIWGAFSLKSVSNDHADRG